MNSDNHSGHATLANERGQETARRGRPKSDSKRQAILQAATEVFVEHGYGETSVDRVAAAAGVSKATIYSHFESKDGLIEAVIDTRAAEVLSGFDDLDSADDDTAARLVRFCVAFQEHVLTSEMRAWDRLVIAEVHRAPGLAKKLFDCGPKSLHARLAEYLRKQTDAGHLSAENADEAAEDLMGLVLGLRLVSGQMGVGKKESRKARVARAERIVRFFMLAYGPAKPG